MKFINLVKNFLKKENLWQGSAKYWENRYRSGGNSGAGSYNNLADFKAQILNDFVSKNSISSVIEWGCGDGNQLLLSKYPQYIGIDVSKKAIKICKSKFKKDSTKKFYWSGKKNFSFFQTADLTLSLDVIYHLIEDDVFECYMRQLFSSSNKYVIIYSCNFDNDPIDAHVKCRKFTPWIEKNFKDWNLKDVVKNQYPYDGINSISTSWSDFFIYEHI